MSYYTFPVTYTEGGQVASSSQTLTVYDQIVSELLFNGANGGTSFPDSSSRTWTRGGNAQTSTAQFVEGTASLLLDGSGDYLQTASGAELQNQGDWRIECAVRPATVASLRCICAKRPSTGNPEYNFAINGTGKLFFQVWDNLNNVIVQLTGSTSLVVNAWADVAVERLGNTYRVLVNGAQEDAATVAGGFTGTNNLIIGRDAFTSARDFNGYIDRFRFLRA